MSRGSGSTKSTVPSRRASSSRPVVETLRVDRIRPEEGLGRKRDRAGHDELCQSIRQFGVLTPITVRLASDDSGDYLLVKGQGRTLACQRLGLVTIPAVIVGDDFGEAEKVQQFLVENVARLKMRPIDRALLIRHARASGEETAAVAKRFGISAATVRRLDAQLDGATSGEMAALRAGDLNLAIHAVIARFAPDIDREEIIRAVSGTGLRASELTALLMALGWPSLVELGNTARASRLLLLRWACNQFAMLPRGSLSDRLRSLAENLPMVLTADGAEEASA